ncbi:Ribonuclease 3 [Blattabacterium sp. (Nauphoeta cinerea)]|uniref:ribonuclease III family protein n=1 Tax=Blattabacterium sp. (Nauphoeta cinerea) TaxID=1316444 RepID=UPI0003B0E9ED|nr:ribonuclease III domain-containing protein [Blattabacterium sp. (Nauphoeta cinerea)]AGW85861.1 Ribonuclease 3 [Blattabacterium sp. (Nauphoeta cinerea)]
MLSKNSNFFEKNNDYLVVRILIKILGFRPKNTEFLKEVFLYSFSAKKEILIKIILLIFKDLGDAVLNSIISHFLCEKFPEKKEGELTQIRSQIVCRKNLNEISKKLTIADIFFDKSMIYDNNILGNTLEALIGFIYLDRGYQSCENFVHKKILHTHVNFEKLQNEIYSYKVWIMEWAQKNKFFINFKTFRENKNQNKIIYLSEFTISEYGIQTKGRGSSKKKSEEMAAKEAYFIIQDKYTKNTHIK